MTSSVPIHSPVISSMRTLNPAWSLLMMFTSDTVPESRTVFPAGIGDSAVRGRRQALQRDGEIDDPVEIRAGEGGQDRGTDQEKNAREDGYGSAHQPLLGGNTMEDSHPGQSIDVLGGFCYSAICIAHGGLLVFR